MKMQQATLSFTNAGTPQSEAFGDVYFSVDNGVAESEYVFLKGNQLLEQWQSCTQSHFCIAETGFGTGLNFLLTCQLFERFLEQNPDAQLKSLYYISFEKYPIAIGELQAIHDKWKDLTSYSNALIKQYPPALEGIHRSYYKLGDHKNAIKLDLVLFEAHEGMAQVHNIDDGIVNAWYLDGFAPSKNESMWDIEVYQQMARLSAENASLSTFTAAGAVRRGLESVGFEVSKIKGFGRKREMITARFMPAKASLKNQQAPYFQRATHNSNNIPRHVAIVGAGIAGSLLAMRLTEQGMRVSLICKDEKPAQGASGNAVGGFYPQLNAEASVNSQFFVHAFLYARRFYDELLQDGIDFEHQWCGVLQLGFNKNTQERLTKIHLKNLWPDELAQVIDAKQATEIAGIDIPHGALFLPKAGWIAPVSLVQACLKHAERSGLLTSYYQHDLLGYESTAEGVSLNLSGTTRSLLADTLVIAAGSHSPDIAQELIPMRLTRGQVESVPKQASSENLRSVICHKGYFTPAVNGHHALGSSYVKNDLSTEHRIRELEQNLKLHSDAMGEAEWMQAIKQLKHERISGRAAIRCSTPDHLPLVGAMPNIDEQKQELKDLYKALPLNRYPQGSKVKGVYLLSGLGSRGITSAPILVDILVAELCRKPMPMGNTLLDALNPNRFLVRSLIRQQAYSPAGTDE